MISGGENVDAKKFGSFLSVLRKEKNMTQAELASKLMVTDKAISRWERGVGFPDIVMLEPLADVLDVSVAELINSKRATAAPFESSEIDVAVKNTIEIATNQYNSTWNKAALISMIAMIVMLACVVRVTTGKSWLFISILTMIALLVIAVVWYLKKKSDR
jgi:transcriptional regulator with XRE-family HTH domain